MKTLATRKRMQRPLKVVKKFEQNLKNKKKFSKFSWNFWHIHLTVDLLTSLFHNSHLPMFLQQRVMRTSIQDYGTFIQLFFPALFRR